MREPVTEIACIVDRSGSMHSIAEDAVGGFNRFLEEQKALPGRARLTLVLFDHEYQLLCAGLDLRRVPPLDDRLYRPRGMTALLDAVGRTLDDLDRRAAFPVPTSPMLRSRLKRRLGTPWRRPLGKTRWMNPSPSCAGAKRPWNVSSTSFAAGKTASRANGPTARKAPRAMCPCAAP